MDTIKNFYAWSPSKLIIAYLLAVTTASLVFALSSSLPEIPNIIAGKGFESATVYDTPTKFKHLAIMSTLVFASSWVFSFAAALIPYAACLIFAQHFAIMHWFYFVSGGTITAIVIELIIIATLGNGRIVHESFLNGFLHFIPPGTAAGFSCFVYLRSAFLSFRQRGESQIISNIQSTGPE